MSGEQVQTSAFGTVSVAVPSSDLAIDLGHSDLAQSEWEHMERIEFVLCNGTFFHGADHPS